MPNGYIHYHRGLRKGDPLSPLLFVLVTDVLSTIFTHALRSKVLVVVPFEEFGSRCDLHYADDLLVLTMGGLEDLRIAKLILYLLEGISGLETNFVKTYLYSSKMGELLKDVAAKILNYGVGFLPVTYMVVSITSRRP